MDKKRLDEGRSSLIRLDIIVDILNGYGLPLLGVHGVSHWGRVLETGQRIAAQNGADTVVVAYFSVFHDSRRTMDDDDPGHGNRGANLAEKMQSKLGLTNEQLAELKYACRNHTNGATDGSITVQTCWDADRLDLWRVGIRPSRSRLCTTAGKEEELLVWSKGRSTEEHVPECSRNWLRAFGAD